MKTKYQCFPTILLENIWHCNALLHKSPKKGSSSADLPGDLNVDSQRNRVECEAKVGKLLLKVFIYNRTLESSKHCCCEINCKYQDVCFRVASMYGFNPTQWILMCCVDILVVLLINLLFLSKPSGYFCCSSNKPFIFDPTDKTGCKGGYSCCSNQTFIAPKASAEGACI